MDYIAESKNVRISPRKARLVADSLRKLSPDKARVFLKLAPQRAAVSILKTLESALANAANNFKADLNGLTIKAINVEEGASLKRYHYAARGRVRPYKKRSSHIKVVLTDETKKLKALSAGKQVKEEKIKIKEKTKAKETKKA